METRPILVQNRQEFYRVPRPTRSTLNLAAWTFPTKVLGPGRRFAIWLQGCVFDCPGCVAPEFLPVHQARLVPVRNALAMILAADDCEGVTVSGGEPMMQAEALAPLLCLLKRAKPDLSVIVYSGYRLKELRAMTRKRPAIGQTLRRTDVLIDGRYQHAENESRGLRGSTNQQVHFLSSRYSGMRDYFENVDRRYEIHAQDDGELAVGLPTLKDWRRVALDPTGGEWYGRDRFDA